MNTILSDQELDVSGCTCPLPVLKARAALQAMPLGSILKVISTDPLSLKDFPLFCQQTGMELCQQETRAGQYLFWLRKT